MKNISRYLLIAATLLICAAGLQFVVALVKIYVAFKGGAA